jgi:hypothetical protein
MVVLFAWIRRRLANTPGVDAPGGTTPAFATPGVGAAGLRAGMPAWRPAALLAIALAALLVATHAALRAGQQHAYFHGIEFVAATSALGAFALFYVALGVTIVIARRRPARSAGPRQAGPRQTPR